MKYSPSSSRKTLRVIMTSEQSPYGAGKGYPPDSMTSVTSAMLTGCASSLPLKMTSSIFLPRRSDTRCSPMTHRMASMMLLFPQPFGPTMPLMPEEKSMTVLSRKDLNPMISSRLSFIPSPCFCQFADG